MDGARFDGLARALASSKTRRGYILATLGFLGASALAVRGTTEASHGGCREKGQSCSLASSCCSGSVCVRTSLFNPNVGVCEADSTATSTPTSIPGTRTPTPRPTNTPSPTPSPTPTPRPGEVLRVPLTVRLDCSKVGEQSIFFNYRGQLRLRVVTLRTYLQEHQGALSTPGPRLSRNQRRVLWRWRCTLPGQNNCISDQPLFDTNNPTLPSTDRALFHLRYVGLDCDAQVTCAQGVNPDGILPCVRR